MLQCLLRHICSSCERLLSVMNVEQCFLQLFRWLWICLCCTVLIQKTLLTVLKCQTTEVNIYLQCLWGETSGIPTDWRATGLFAFCKMHKSRDSSLDGWRKEMISQSTTDHFCRPVEVLKNTPPLIRPLPKYTFFCKK